MGCTTSKPLVETTDDVLRNCKIRRLHIQDAIKHRKDFAIAHAAYIHSLKDVGSALRNFTQGELVDEDMSLGSPSTSVLALPPPLSPSIGGLSPPPHSNSSAATLSPPRSGSRDIVDGNGPTSLPLTISISPPLSPIRLPTSDHLSSTQLPTSSPIESPAASLHATSPRLNRTDVPLRSSSLNNMVSPDRASEFSPPYYSPSRDDLDDALVAYSPLPPPSLISDSLWFNLDIFTPSPIPEHLQKQRRMKRAGDLEQEDIQGPLEVDEIEGIPDLEEVEQKLDEVARDEKDERMPEEVEKKVVVDETVDVSELKANEDKPVVDNLEEDPLVTRVVQPEVVGLEGAGDEKPKKEPAPVIILKERNVTEAMRHIDYLFARAFQCGRDVSRMLETHMYHESRGSDMKDSSKIFNAITSHWSKKTPSVMEDAHEDDDLLECGMSGSHVSTLERLQAWERKLYHEVKEGKLLRITFDLKFKQLHNLNAKGGDQIVRDKLKATLKKLDMRLMVAIRAIRAASMRIQLLTNEELYPQLCEMLRGLMSMWRMMSECHRIQAAIALEMQTFEDSAADIEATEVHKRATVKLKDELEKLQTHFQGWIQSQKKYIDELEKWIKKCYETREPSKEPIKNRKGSSESTEKAPIFYLLKAWKDFPVGLDSQQEVFSSMKSFVAVLRTLEENQSNEMKLKRQAAKSTKRLDQQTVSLNKLERWYTENGNASPTIRSSRMSRMPSTSKLQGRKTRLDKYKSQVETEKREHSAAVQVRKNVTIELLKQQLLILFQSLTSFAEDIQKMYENVKERAEAGENKPNGAARLGWEEQR